MIALQDLQFLVRAGRATSLSEAARATGISPAAGSALVKRLEAELGIKLFVRSTRSLRPSAQALAFLAECEEGLARIELARERLQAGRQVMRGRIQLSLPSDLGRNQVLTWLHAFRGRHPEVSLGLQISDRIAEVYREQVDVALRYGEPKDSSLVALPIAPHNQRVLCASPAYLAQHGRPQEPKDLKQHNCLSFMLSDRNHDNWQFVRDQTKLTVRVTGAIQCDDGDAVRHLARMGAGIAYKSRLDVHQDLKQGTLIALCEDWQGEPAPLYMACPDRSQLRPPVLALRSFLIEKINALD
ncbi:LysR family transcriptional regulator [Rhodoferax fermentans]|uniref:LysR family transcriptional regulator n=1 Tax=Rhodoferax fermentans TaxID=28066 RepID=A0A1T1AQU0_RHOFE|nr:LysR family transcriptional regulator [Rhodoferax fermentans]MBK1683587.1 LysR family transcriptional regulator [Rhodoferax fermentans]OOV06328.1 LysR family transcriptional regulator [Rhodoferax fermentans]